MVEEKGAVEMQAVSEAEVAMFMRHHGYDVVECERLYGGYCSTNVRVVVTRPGEEFRTTVLLKLSNEAVSREDLMHQVTVLGVLKPLGFPTNYVNSTPSGEMIVEQDGRRAMVLDFFTATSGDKLLGAHEADTTFVEKMMRELGGTLATLHLSPWPPEASLRHVRTHGFAVCYTGDLLNGTAFDDLDASHVVREHEFLATVRGSLAWLRQLYDRDLPQGLIHGDPYLDNVLYSPDGDLLALIDWEDSCQGPFVLDLAACVGACCFSSVNELSVERMESVFKGYSAKRSLSRVEAECVPDFIAATALACAFYRFGEFWVRRPTSDERVRNSFQLMADRAQLVMKAETRSVIRDAACRICVPTPEISR